MKEIAGGFTTILGYTCDPGSFSYIDNFVEGFTLTAPSGEDAYTGFMSLGFTVYSNEGGQNQIVSYTSFDNYGGDGGGGTGVTNYDTRLHSFRGYPEMETRDTVGSVPQETDFDQTYWSYGTENRILSSGLSFTEAEDYFLPILSNTQSPLITIENGTTTTGAVDYWDTIAVNGMVIQPYYPVGYLGLENAEDISSTSWGDNTFSTISETVNLFTKRFTRVGEAWEAINITTTEDDERPSETTILNAFSFRNVGLSGISKSVQTFISGNLTTTTQYLATTRLYEDHSQSAISFGLTYPPVGVVSTRTEDLVIYVKAPIDVFATYHEIDGLFTKASMGTLKSSFMTTVDGDFETTYYAPYYLNDAGSTYDTDSAGTYSASSEKIVNRKYADTVIFPSLIFHPAGYVNLFEPICVAGYLPFGETNSDSPIYSFSKSSRISGENYADSFSVDFPGYYLIPRVKKFPDDVFFTKTGVTLRSESTTLISSSEFEIQGPYGTKNPESQYTSTYTEFEGGEILTETVSYDDTLVGSVTDGTIWGTSYFTTSGYTSGYYTDIFASHGDNPDYRRFSITRSFDDGVYKMIAGVSLLSPRDGDERFETYQYQNPICGTDKLSIGGNNGIEDLFSRGADKTLEIFHGNWFATKYGSSTSEELEMRLLFESNNENVRSTLTLGKDEFLILSHKITPRQFRIGADFTTPGIISQNEPNYLLLVSAQSEFGNIFNQNGLAEARWTTEELGDR